MHLNPSFWISFVDKYVSWQSLQISLKWLCWNKFSWIKQSKQIVQFIFDLFCEMFCKKGKKQEKSISRLRRFYVSFCIFCFFFFQHYKIILFVIHFHFNHVFVPTPPLISISKMSSSVVNKKAPVFMTLSRQDMAAYEFLCLNVCNLFNFYCSFFKKCFFFPFYI